MLHLLKSLLIIFFIALIAVHVYYAFAIHINTLSFLFTRMGLLFALTIVINNKTKTTWFLGLFLAIYGLVDFIIIGNSEFNPALMDFTSPLIVIFKDANIFVQRLISVFPAIFFFLLALAFSTSPVRQWYGFPPPRINPKEGYL